MHVHVPGGMSTNVRRKKETHLANLRTWSQFYIHSKTYSFPIVTICHKYHFLLNLSTLLFAEAQEYQKM